MAQYFVFTNHPAYPSRIRCEVDAIRIYRRRRAYTLDLLPPTVGKLTTVEARNKKEAIRKSGIVCPKRRK
jgi:hypothetical protein